MDLYPPTNIYLEVNQETPVGGILLGLGLFP